MTPLFQAGAVPSPTAAAGHPADPAAAYKDRRYESAVSATLNAATERAADSHKAPTKPFVRTHRASSSVPTATVSSAIEQAATAESASLKVTASGGRQWWRKWKPQKHDDVSPQSSHHFPMIYTTSERSAAPISTATSASAPSAPPRPSKQRRKTSSGGKTKKSGLIKYPDWLLQNQSKKHTQLLTSIFTLLTHDIPAADNYQTDANLTAWDDAGSSRQIELLRIERQSLTKKLAELRDKINKEVTVHKATTRLLQLYSSNMPISLSTSSHVHRATDPGNIYSTLPASASSSSSRQQKEAMSISAPHPHPRHYSSNGRHYNTLPAQVHGREVPAVEQVTSELSRLTMERVSVHLPPTQLRDPYEASTRAFMNSTQSLMAHFGEYMDVAGELQLCSDRMLALVGACLMDGCAQTKRDLDLAETDRQRWQMLAESSGQTAVNPAGTLHADPWVRSVMAEMLRRPA